MSGPVVAAMDAGTNSLRLLIARVQHGRLEPLVRCMQIVRLGQGVDRTGVLMPQAMDRAVAACEQFAAQCRQHGVVAGRMVATSAMRDAGNSTHFLERARAALGWPIEIISGPQEARLSFAGALLALPSQEQPPVAVLDIGGGSTEVVLGTREQGPSHAGSADVGGVRLTERHFRTDPPTPEQVAAARADVAAALAATHVELASARTAIAVAGTATTVAAHALGLASYDREAIHGVRLGAEQIRLACQQYLHLTHAQRVAQPYLHPGRVDVIAAGALILDHIVSNAGWAELIISESDLLDALAFSLAELA